LWKKRKERGESIQTKRIQENGFSPTYVFALSGIKKGKNETWEQLSKTKPLIGRREQNE